MQKDRIYLFHGTDIPAVYARKQQAGNGTAETVEQGKEHSTTAEIVQQINQPSLFTEVRRFEFVNPLFLTQKDESIPAKEFLQALENVPAETRVFFILEGKPDRRLSLVKKILPLAQVSMSEFIPGWKVSAAFDSVLRAQDRGLSRAARQYLQAVAESWENISSVFITTEAQKWQLMTDQKEIPLEVVQESLPSYLQRQVFRFWDDLVDQRKRSVLEAVPHLFDGIDETLKNTGFLASQLRLCLGIYELEHAGFATRDMARELQVKNQWRWKNVYAAAQKLNYEQCATLLLALYRTQWRQRNGYDVSWRELFSEYLRGTL
ncbi:MAG: hypothetical protein KIB08_01175 [Negativicoccus succinicivorans]|uniref:DNA polymerase III subunit delta n=1 Tax=Negativicoccus succinicivorans TaxID=620903 RepID=UPI0026F35BF6|nr:hypothetical protein [Negativicoccus succinicivorans]MBS5887124.1 hypothetical protein [Negativicoccus succinicivorans]